jgi:hypothetical protein
MDEPSSREDSLVIVRRTYQEVIDTLLFISDEIEMQLLPTRDGGKRGWIGCGSVRVTKELT